MKQILTLIIIIICIVFFINNVNYYQLIEGARGGRGGSSSSGGSSRFNNLEKKISDQNGIIKKMQEKIDKLTNLEDRVKGVKKKTRKIPRRM